MNNATSNLPIVYPARPLYRCVAGSGVAIAHNARSQVEVDAVLAEAVAAGARLIKSARRVFWGGYSGYFADPDGHIWEVAYNPGWALDADGRVALPPRKPAR